MLIVCYNYLEGGYDMIKPKVVFLDVDYTLRDHNKMISLKNLEAIAKAKEKGVIVILTSGQGVKTLEGIYRECGSSNYVIGSNGAQVYDFINKEFIFSDIINPRTILDIFTYCEENKLGIILNIGLERYSNYNDSRCRTIFCKSSKIIELINQEPVSQIVIKGENFHRMLVIPKMFKTKYQDIKVANSSPELIAKIPKPGKYYFHDIANINISKSKGIVELLDHLGISPEETMAIGNGINDIPMCQIVGYSIAMANGNQLLKDIVNEETASCEDNGVAKALNKIFNLGMEFKNENN